MLPSQRVFCLCVLAGLFVAVNSARADDVKPLEIGAAAPELDIPGVDDRTYRLRDFADAKVLVVIFTCNHCPTAQAYEERIVELEKEFRDKGVQLVAISPNDPLAVRLDELGYTDIGDSLDDMKLHAARRGWTFPYLYDGETQRVSREFGVLATPHVFIFDELRKLRYNGRIDDSEVKEPTSHDARNAIDALLAGKPVPVEKTRVFGCSTKWASKRESAEQSLRKWEAEPVELNSVSPKAIRQLAANDTENYRLVNIWSTTCAPCITELPEFVTVHRMYRGRHFEFYTLSIDDPDRKDHALGILQKYHVSATNFIVDRGDGLDAFADALDPEWQGPVPYTLLIAPGGEIVERWNDEIDPQELKTTISSRLGRTYASRKEPRKQAP